MDNYDPNKDIDLHESEWHHEKKREPILGSNGFEFICMALGCIPAYFFSKWVVSVIFG